MGNSLYGSTDFLPNGLQNPWRNIYQPGNDLMFDMVGWGAIGKSILTGALRGVGTRGVAREVGGSNALPRHVNGFWGKVFQYRHGGNMSAIEHIMYRHSYNSGFSNVGKFSKGTTARMIKEYVDDALKYGKEIDNGFEFNVGRTIGTSMNEEPARIIRVFVRDGWVRTAFPVN